jgi:pilus assembly protein Flp/PilA
MRKFIEVCRSAVAWSKTDSEEGAVAIEYGLIATFIAIAIVAAVTGVGNKLIAVFGAITAAL